MTTKRIAHDRREQSVLTDLNTCFPNFAGHVSSWIKVPDGQDPPDFISRESGGMIGLELVEWLDGSQMGSAKTREAHREQIDRVLSHDWEKEYQPTNIRGVFPSPLENRRIARSDELPLRREFLDCVAEIDRTWVTTDLEHCENSYYQTEFSSYPVLKKYFNAIRYIGGRPHGLCWIGEQGDGGAFDPALPIETLKQTLHHKLSGYSTPEKRAHLNAQGLSELNLLVHGGFNVEVYNTPAGHITLEEIGKRGADYYSAHAMRCLFDHVWFYHSLDTVDDLYKLIGFPTGYGRVRWLAQLWPDFKIYSGSQVR
jgi:hypothetical protein